MAFAIVQTLREFYDMAIGKKGFIAERILAMLSAGLLYAFLVSYMSGAITQIRLLAVAFVPILLIAVIPIWHKDHSDHGKIAYIFAGLAYVGYPLALIPILQYHDGVQDGWIVLALLAIVWGADVGAYFIGSALGRRPGAIRLAPSISPKKSLWGLAGAILFGIGCAVGFHYLGILNFGIAHAVAIGLIGSIGGQLGDLVESMWKRHFDVKDSGNLIPGHGGLYDRLDSVILALPMITLYLAIAGLL